MSQLELLRARIAPLASRAVSDCLSWSAPGVGSCATCLRARRGGLHAPRNLHAHLQRSASRTAAAEEPLIWLTLLAYVCITRSARACVACLSSALVAFAVSSPVAQYQLSSWRAAPPTPWADVGSIPQGGCRQVDVTPPKPRLRLLSRVSACQGPNRRRRRRRRGRHAPSASFPEQDHGSATVPAKSRPRHSGCGAAGCCLGAGCW